MTFQSLIGEPDFSLSLLLLGTKEELEDRFIKGDYTPCEEPASLPVGEHLQRKRDVER